MIPDLFQIPNVVMTLAPVLVFLARILHDEDREIFTGTALKKVARKGVVLFGSIGLVGVGGWLLLTAVAGTELNTKVVRETRSAYLIGVFIQTAALLTERSFQFPRYSQPERKAATVFNFVSSIYVFGIGAVVVALEPVIPFLSIETTTLIPVLSVGIGMKFVKAAFDVTAPS